MTFNIRYNNPNDGENAWPKRKELVANLVRFHQVDLLGVQEALKEQMDDLSQLLPEFDWIGVGRDDGREKGEYSSILFRKERFALLQQRTFWLSATPEQAGSVGWDAAITRVCTWGKFKDRQTGKIFFLFMIDYIFVNSRVAVLRHGTIAEANDGRYASDHLPVMAEVDLAPLKNIRAR